MQRDNVNRIPEEATHMARKTRQELEQEVAELTESLETAREALSEALETVDDVLGLEDESDDAEEPNGKNEPYEA